MRLSTHGIVSADGFRPDRLDDLAFWADANYRQKVLQSSGSLESPASPGNPVIRWLPVGGRYTPFGDSFEQDTKSMRPTYVEDGNGRWLSFDGVDDEMELTPVPSATDTAYTLFLLISRPRSGWYFGSLGTSGQSGNPGSFQIERDGSDIRSRFRSDGDTNVSISGGQVTDNSTHLVTLASDGGGQQMWVDGGSAGTLDSPSEGRFAQICLGRANQSDSTQRGEVRIGTLVLYLRDLAASERADVEHFILSQRGLT